jgi:hypothetical protein
VETARKGQSGLVEQLGAIVNGVPDCPIAPLALFEREVSATSPNTSSPPTLHRSESQRADEGACFLRRDAGHSRSQKPVHQPLARVPDGSFRQGTRRRGPPPSLHGEPSSPTPISTGTRKRPSARSYAGKTTLVSTGTGPGKTGCFLYPVISRALLNLCDPLLYSIRPCVKPVQKSSPTGLPVSPPSASDENRTFLPRSVFQIQKRAHSEKLV